jgi:hypothetical protein
LGFGLQPGGYRRAIGENDDNACGYDYLDLNLYVNFNISIYVNFNLNKHYDNHTSAPI